MKIKTNRTAKKFVVLLYHEEKIVDSSEISRLPKAMNVAREQMPYNNYNHKRAMFHSTA